MDCSKSQCALDLHVTSPSKMSAITSTLKPLAEFKYIQDDVTNIIEVVNLVFLCGVISLFGMVTNVINIMVFVKQGVKDSITISFIALAVSDFCSLVPLFWSSFCYNPLIRDMDTIPYHYPEVWYLTAAWPHACFARITGILTTYITFERCLCVAMPLKVKRILTPGRTKAIVVLCYLIFIGGVSPLYFVNHFGWKFFPEKNRSLVALSFSENRFDFLIYVVGFFYIGFPNLCFVGVIVCTVVLVAIMRKKTKWRKVTAAPGSEEKDVSARDKNVSRMVVLISSVFIISFIPQVFGSLMVVMSADFDFNGKYRNVYYVFFSTNYVIEAVNSSINILVYYKMSENFRIVFKQIFRNCPKLSA